MTRTQVNLMNMTRESLWEGLTKFKKKKGKGRGKEGQKREKV